MTRSIPILLFHQVTTEPGTSRSHPARFEENLAWLADHGYRSLTMDEFERILNGGLEHDRQRRVLLTFDDGHADLHTTIAPALKRHGFTGIAFVITGEAPLADDAIAAPAAHPPRLSWARTRALAADGVLEFHSHSHSHRRWSMAPDGIATVTQDLAASLDLLTSELRMPRAAFRHLAWPWGQCSEAWEAAAKRLGFSHQYLVQKGAVNQAGVRTRLPRLDCDGMSTASLARWLRLLSSAPGTVACNRIFGTLRAKRHGLGYV